MNVPTISNRTGFAALCAFTVYALATLGHAQDTVKPVAPAAPVAITAPERVEVPDGAPQLPAEKVISNQSQTVATRSAGNMVIDEERIQGRLATASVSVGGSKGYSVVDPAVGRVDRQADNSGKRVSPSLWQLFKF